MATVLGEEGRRARQEDSQEGRTGGHAVHDTSWVPQPFPEYALTRKLRWPRHWHFSCQDFLFREDVCKNKHSDANCTLHTLVMCSTNNIWKPFYKEEKLRIRETPTLSTCADSSTDTRKFCLFDPFLYFWALLTIFLVLFL